MKLRILAVAVAMASVSVAAQADVSISGDVGVGYSANHDGTDSFGPFGSEVNFAAEEKVGSLTYFGNANVDLAPGSAVADDLRVGVKGGFGSLTMGDTDNGCDATDIGGTNEVNITHGQGGCKGSDNNNITYARSFGNFSGAISHNPDAEVSAIGVKGAVGPVGVSLGYETGVEETAAVASGADNPSTCTVATEALLTGTDGTEFCSGGSAVLGGAPATPGTPGATGNNIVLGLTGKIGPISVGFRANKVGDNDALHGINALYSRGGHNIYGGLGTSDGNDSKSIGYKRVIGNTDFILEAADSGKSGDDTALSIGMRHRF